MGTNGHSETCKIGQMDSFSMLLDTINFLDFFLESIPEFSPFVPARHLLKKVRSLKICPVAILMSLEENPYIVPHLKATISDQKFWSEQRCGSTLSL